MNKLRAWPHFAIIALIFFAIGGGAVVLWSMYQSSTASAALPNAARLERVNGEVGLSRALNDNGESQWVNAEQNTPLSVGDRIYTKDNADASIAFTGRNFARLNPDTSLDVLALSDEKTQLALRDGSGVFEVGSLNSGDLFEVATPCGAVDFTEPGLYQIDINDTGNATATVLSGSAELLGQGGTGRISRGESLTVPCEGAAAATRLQVEPSAAGAFVDHYYRDRYPRIYDGRYANYDSYLSDPFYYDPYRRYPSYQYVSEYIPGVDYLDDYGYWQNVSGYGECWHPYVDNGWAPYQSGYWSTDYPYGLTWISDEPWGYAPYHYGRWASVSNQWFWVPDRVRTRPVYAPALVAFIPFTQTDTIGWVPLGPGDPYVPRYYDANWNPRYFSRNRDVTRVINLNVPGAVTVVNVRDIDRVDRRRIERIDSHQFAQARPLLDPLSVRPLRDAALQSREGRSRFDVPTRVAQRLDRPVITSSTPSVPFRKDLAQRLRAQSLPDNVRSKRLELSQNQQANPGRQTAAAANQAAEQARERRIADLSQESERGNRAARQEMQQLQREQRQAQRDQRQTEQQQRQQNAIQLRNDQGNVRMALPQARGERVSNDVRQGSQPGVDRQTEDQRRGNQQRMLRQQNQQAPQANRQPRPLITQPRQVQRQSKPQFSDRGRNMRPAMRQPQAQPQPRAIQPRATQPPRAMPERRSIQAQPRPQPQQRMRAPQPQAQPRPGEVRQQSRPKNEGRSSPQPTPGSSSQPKDGKGKGRP